MAKSETESFITDEGVKTPYDPLWRGTVPSRARECTDFFCIPIFFVFMLLTLVGGVGIRGYYGIMDPLLDFGAFETHPARIANATHFAVFDNAFNFTRNEAMVGAATFAVAPVLTITWLLMVRFATYVVLVLSAATVSIIMIGLCVLQVMVGNWWDAWKPAILAILVVAYPIIARKQVPTAVSFIKEGASAVMSNPALALFVTPTLSLGMMIASIVMYYFTMMWFQVVTVVSISYSIFAFFSFIWLICTIANVQRISIAHCTASWYVLRRGRNSERASAFVGLMLACTRHYGTVVLAASISAGLRMIRIFASVARNRAGATGAGALALFACCCEWLIMLIVALVEYVNRYAMIYVAIHGEAYISSAKRVKQLVKRSKFQNFRNDIILGIILLANILLIELAVVCAGFGVSWLLQGNFEACLSLPFFVGIFGAIVVAVMFSTLLTTSVDTIFVSYMEDIERNAENGRPLLCSPEWQEAIASHPQCPPSAKALSLPPPIEASEGDYVDINSYTATAPADGGAGQFGRAGLPSVGGSVNL